MAVTRGQAVGAWLAALLAAGLVTWAVVREGPWALSLDTSLTAAIRRWADGTGWAVPAADVLGTLTAPVPSVLYGIAVVILLTRAGHRVEPALVAVSGVLGVTIAEILKTAVGRARPPGAEQYQDDLLRSFPSGHTMVGIYGYVVVGLVALRLRGNGGPRWLGPLGWFLIVLGPVIGLSRLVLGVHWPTDVLAGWALGALAALTAALLLWDRLSPSPDGAEPVDAPGPT